MLIARRSVGLVLFAVALASASACSPTTQIEVAATPEDAPPVLDEAALFEDLGCDVKFDEGSVPEGHEAATVHLCTGDDVASAAVPRSHLVLFDSEGAKAIYVAEARDAIESRSDGTRLVVGDGTWVVWGDNLDVLAAAVDAGGALDD